MRSAIQWPPASTAISFSDFQAMLLEAPHLHSGPGSITWRVNGERILVLGWGRAVLMQIAHPLIAEGIGQHSTFSSSPAAKFKRFRRTLDGMLRLTFGTPYEVWNMGRGIDQIHARINGELADNSAHSVRYSARDPELLKWVHATLVDSMLRTYSLCVRPLSAAEKDDYVHKAGIVGPLLGAPPGFFPNNYGEMSIYIQHTLNSGVLQIGPRARQLADYVLDGFPVPVLGGATAWAIRLWTAGLLPLPLRRAYGFRWDKRGEAIIQSSAYLSRKLHLFLPTSLRRWEVAAQAEQRAAGQSTQGVEYATY